jgi:small subunit ribosomal protein S8
MNVTDPVADLLTRLRNAIHARQEKVSVPHSKVKLEILRILKEEGYISNYAEEEIGKNRSIQVFLRYSSKFQPPVSKLERISRPGCRVYVGRDEIPEVLGGLGINIISTSRGIMTGRQARQLGVGGELLCVVS